MSKKNEIGFSDLSTWLKILVIYGFVSLSAAVLWNVLLIIGILIAI